MISSCTLIVEDVTATKVKFELNSSFHFFSLSSPNLKQLALNDGSAIKVSSHNVS